MQESNLKFIDALRGYAILGVLFFHCGEFGNNELLPERLKMMHFHGAYGVQLFYLISAFTLFLSLSVNRVSTKVFFLKRLFRIAPMYYIVILFYVLYFYNGGSFPVEVSAGLIISNILFFHGLEPNYINSLIPGGWSVGIEMLFYLIVPFLFKYIKNVQQALYFFLISLIVRWITLNILTHVNTNFSPRIWSDYLYFFFPNQLPVFVLGIILFFIFENKNKIPISSGYLLIFSVVIICN